MLASPWLPPQTGLRAREADVGWEGSPGCGRAQSRWLLWPGPLKAVREYRQSGVHTQVGPGGAEGLEAEVSDPGTARGPAPLCLHHFQAA